MEFNKYNLINYMMGISMEKKIISLIIKLILARQINFPFNISISGSTILLQTARSVAQKIVPLPHLHSIDRSFCFFAQMCVRFQKRNQIKFSNGNVNIYPKELRS